MIPRQALTLVTVFFVLLKYCGCFAVLGAVAVLLPCSRSRRAPSRQLHLRTAAQSQPDMVVLSQQMWGLADAAVSRQPWAAAASRLGASPASLRGAGDRGAMGSCSRLLSGCPSGGMGDGFRAENVAGEAPGKLVRFAPSLVSLHEFWTRHPLITPELPSGGLRCPPPAAL